jgi:hypothetical protein
MFAEKQKLVQDLEVYGAGGAGYTAPAAAAPAVVEEPAAAPAPEETPAD